MGRLTPTKKESNQNDKNTSTIAKKIDSTDHAIYDEDNNLLVNYDEDFSDLDEKSTSKEDMNVDALEDKEINSNRESEKVIPTVQPTQQLLDEKIEKKIKKTHLLSKLCSIPQQNNTKSSVSRHNSRRAHNQSNSNARKSSYRAKSPNHQRGHERGHKPNYNQHQHQHQQRYPKRQSTNNFSRTNSNTNENVRNRNLHQRATNPSNRNMYRNEESNMFRDQSVSKNGQPKMRNVGGDFPPNEISIKPTSSSIKDATQFQQRTFDQNLEQNKRGFSENKMNSTLKKKQKKQKQQEQCGVKIPRFSTKILHHHPRIMFGDYLQGVCMNHIVAGDNTNGKGQKVDSKRRNFYRKLWTDPLRKAMIHKVERTVHPASKQTVMTCCNEAKFNIEKYEQQGFSPSRLIENMVAFLFYLKYGIETVKLQQSCLDTLKNKYPGQNKSMPETKPRAELSYLPSTTPTQAGIELQRLDDEAKNKPDDNRLNMTMQKEQSMTKKTNKTTKALNDEEYEKLMSTYDDTNRLWFRWLRITKESYGKELLSEKKKFPLTEHQFVKEYLKRKGVRNQDDLVPDYNKLREQFKIYEEIVDSEKKIEDKTECKAYKFEKNYIPANEMEFMLHFCHNPALNKNEDRYVLYFEMLDDWRKETTYSKNKPDSLTGVEKISKSLKLHNSFSFTPTKSTAKPTTERKTNEPQLENYIIANDFIDVCAIPDNNLLSDNTSCCRISSSITFQHPLGQKNNNVVLNERNAMKDENMVKTICHQENRVSDNSRREIQTYKNEKHSQDKQLHAMIQYGDTKFKEQKSWCSSNKGNHAGPSYKNLYTETVLFSRLNDSFIAREKVCCDQIKEDLLGKKFNNFNMFLVNKFLNRIKKINYGV